MDLQADKHLKVCCSQIGKTGFLVKCLSQSVMQKDQTASYISIKFGGKNLPSFLQNGNILFHYISIVVSATLHQLLHAK